MPRVAACLPRVKRPMNRPPRWLFGVSLLVVACAGGSTEPTELPAPPTLTIGTDTTLLVDEAFAPPVAARDGRGATIASPSIVWQSSSPAVASVDGSGRVTARGLGTATLTATMGSVDAHTTITVVPQFTQIATGELHACGVTGRAEIYCWGLAFHGELGPPSASLDCAARFGLGAMCSPVPV